jgi:nicotinamide-nucleotide amidase
LEEGDKTIVMLPGPPSEMRPMFDEKVMPYLGKYAEYRLESRFLRIFGIGESMLEDMLKDIVEAQSNPTIATYAKEGEVAIRVTARCANRPQLSRDDGPPDSDEPISVDILSPVVNLIRERVGDRMYSEDDEDLEVAALKALSAKNLTLSLAESCTGGLIASRITDIPGSSKTFLSSAVTYSNEAKSSILGVRAQTLQAYGAVSSQTACEMACGARRAFGSDVALSVTGIAGPGGGGENKPVGLVYLAISDKDGTRAKEIRVTGPRARVRNIACLNAFDMIRRSALGLPWAD